MKVYTRMIYAVVLLLIGMICISLYSCRQITLQEQPKPPFVTELNADEHPSEYIQEAESQDDNCKETCRQEFIVSENFVVYEIEGLISDTDFFWGYEVVSPDTGEVVKRLPYLSWCWLMDDDTLLWEEDSPVENHTWLRMLHADGTQALWDANFGIVSQDERGRFLIEQHTGPSDRDANELTKEGRWYYGVLDRDLKTVLLPLQGVAVDNGGGEKGRPIPSFADMDNILNESGK